MLNVLFPKVVDNKFEGNKIVKWLLYIIVFKSFFSGCVHLFASDGGAQSIAGIVLDQFSNGGANTVVTMFAMWGLEQLVIGLIAVIVLWRYKSLIPLMWGMYSVEYILRGVAQFIKPGVESAFTPPGALADTVLIPLTIIMFIYALISSKRKYE